MSPPAIRAVGRVGFELEVEFQTPIPEPPFVLAANHYSHFDSPAIGAALDIPIRFMALEDLFQANRAVTWLVRGYGAIPTPRLRHPVGAVRSALDALGNGETVGVFPEGTRVSHWGVLPPKRGAAWLARQAEVPLVPVAVVGTGKAFGLENRVRRSPIRVIVGASLDAGDEPDETMTSWASWVGKQIERFPESETDGPRQAHFSGY